MEPYQHKCYKVFTEAVEEPYLYSTTLSNGEVIGCYIIEEGEPLEGSLTHDQIKDYIKANHVSPPVEEF